ncbi:MAG: LUD domain-containing protein [Deltaproteobacteria bacterium]|jgi:iron-sulfur cluster protein|nr:LUD domain-containing protein [Deltaproteobacteria bacterium]
MSPSSTWKDYRRKVSGALADQRLREVLGRFAGDYARSREEVFRGVDFSRLRDEVSEIKDRALDDNARLLRRFASEAGKRGAEVILARDAAEAREAILRTARENEVRSAVKSKSMTAEEIALNPALEAAGIKVTETDLGEFLIQLRGEAPSHMVLPAIHLSRFQAAQSFREAGIPGAEGSVENLVRAARRRLRPLFFQADMGITGANFLLASSGAVGVCSNEGNARLCLSLPRVNVILAGLDKLLDGPEDCLPILELLARSATGQRINGYVTWTAGALPAAPADGKRRILKIIILDNGRGALLKDPATRPILRCLRCGACANVCPVYRLVGGHVMGDVYIGAVGLVLSRYLNGSDRSPVLQDNCLACGACREVCPAKCDPLRAILEVRRRGRESGGGSPGLELFSLVLPRRPLFRGLLRLARGLQAPYAFGGGIRHLPLAFARDGGLRSLPALAEKTFSEILPSLELVGAGRISCAVFSGCAHEFVLPGELAAGVRLLSRAGVQVLHPRKQGCCGLPAAALGLEGAARAAARQNVDAFRGVDCDYLTSLCPSCASYMREEYPRFFADDPERLEIWSALSRKIIDFGSLLLREGNLRGELFVRGGERAAYHSPCHLRLGLKAGASHVDLIELAAAYLRTPLENACCGFGGCFSLKFPEESRAMAEEKLADYQRRGAAVVVSDCPGCVMRLRGAAREMGRPLRVEHTAVFLESRLKKTP